jgi:hypothetical protein
MRSEPGGGLCDRFPSDKPPSCRALLTSKAPGFSSFRRKGQPPERARGVFLLSGMTPSTRLAVCLYDRKGLRRHLAEAEALESSGPLLRRRDAYTTQRIALTGILRWSRLLPSARNQGD